MALAKKRQKDSDDNYTLFTLVRLIADLNKKEWKIMVFGLSLSAVVGGNNPTQVVFLAKSITALSLLLSEHAEIRRQANFLSLIYLMLAFVQLLALTLRFHIAQNDLPTESATKHSDIFYGKTLLISTRTRRMP